MPHTRHFSAISFFPQWPSLSRCVLQQHPFFGSREDALHRSQVRLTFPAIFVSRESTKGKIVDEETGGLYLPLIVGN